MHLPDSLKDTVIHGNYRYPFAIHESHELAKNHVLLYLHWHAEAELLLLLEGNADFRIDDRNYTVHAGEAIFIPPYTLHTANVLDSDSCYFAAFVFHPSFFGMDENEALRATYVTPLRKGSWRFPEHLTEDQDWMSEIIRIMHSIVPYAERPQDTCELLIRGKLLEIWHYMFQHASELTKDNSDYERLQPAISYIQANYSNTVTVAKLAEQASLSVSRFSYLFQKEMHMSAITYLLQYRIHQSCILLQTTNMTVASIAMEAGFGNLSNYNRSFLKQMHCTPSAFRLEAVRMREHMSKEPLES